MGHAIDKNLQPANGFFNSRKLKRRNFDALAGESRELLNLIRTDDVLRRGGDFGKEDPVPTDDNLNRRNPDLLNLKLASRSASV